MLFLNVLLFYCPLLLPLTLHCCSAGSQQQCSVVVRGACQGLYIRLQCSHTWHPIVFCSHRSSPKINFLGGYLSLSLKHTHFCLLTVVLRPLLVVLGDHMECWELNTGQMHARQAPSPLTISPVQHTSFKKLWCSMETAPFCGAYKHLVVCKP